VNAGEAKQIEVSGGAIAARLYPATRPGGRAVVLAGALAAPQRYLRHTALGLAAQGWDVLGFDYRGIGESRRWGSPTTNLDRWGEDLRAAVAVARQHFAPQTLLLLGHSLGGMLLGHSGLGDAVDGALLIGSTHGVPSLYRGRGRLRLEAAYRTLPLLARLRGELPASPLLLNVPVPRDAVVQWVRWGQRGRFASWDGQGSEEAFARFRGPLLSICVGDDSYAPVGPVDALLRWFPHAGARREILDPGRDRLGHFGFFSAQAPAWVQARLLTWLDEVASVAG
jgi:predicted alpha/beta hydrolase